ncbi:VOC family protein [Paenibacillus xylaniclasticus]|uniref:VOC family protein n=1 Tax=Paenibacillus xylaniclasticus TaxID=588083 RepID=UPI000FD9BAC7|nr:MULTISPECIES: VOC family protein [Paenibacillus]GFN30757.1 VOC family protein [Paenibacillus curdlanolyticus]
MSVDVYMNFNGNCREAVEFYAYVFETGTPNIMTFGEAPPHPDHPLTEESKNLVMHARIEVEGSTLMFSDVFPGMPFTIGSNITLAFVTVSEDKARTVFKRLSDGGKVEMELQETFWSKLYGQVTDKFGTIWQVNLDSGG